MTSEGAATDTADIEPHPIDREIHRTWSSLDRRLGDQGCARRFRRELVANAAVSGPAFQVATIGVVHPKVAEPPGIFDLPGDAKRVRTIGADARAVDRRSQLSWKSDNVWDSEKKTISARSIICRPVSTEIMIDVNRRERLQNHIAVVKASADPHACTSDSVDDVADLRASRERPPDRRRASQLQWVNLDPRPNNAGRRLDKPIRIGDDPMISCRTADRDAVGINFLVEQID